MGGDGLGVSTLPETCPPENQRNPREATVEEAIERCDHQHAPISDCNAEEYSGKQDFRKSLTDLPATSDIPAQRKQCNDKYHSAGLTMAQSRIELDSYDDAAPVME